jgi:signal transduction histidine kinase
VVALHNVDDSDHAQTRYHQRFGLGQYLGAPIIVDGEVYGTLSFGSERPRSRDFSEDDLDFIRALVQWVRAALKSRTQERALANSQRLLEKAEEVSNVGGWVYDDETDRFTHTDHLATIFEVDDDYSFTPADGHQFFGNEAWSRLMRHIFHAYNEGIPFDTAVPATTGSGRRVWLRISCEVEPGKNASRRIWGTVQDITDRREVEDELSVTAQRLESLLTSLHEGVLVEDQNRQVRLVNEPFCRLFDIDDLPEEIIGTDARSLAITAKSVLVDPDVTLDRLKAIMKSGTSSIGERVELKNGRVLECDYVPIQIDGKRFGHLWKYRDVTLREEREAKLRSAKEAADKARDEAKRAERLKSIFLANMSHEIRTPLTSIIGFAEVLEEEVPEPYDHLAGLVGTSGRRLLNTISSVLDLSKLEANRWQLDVETINVVSELEEAMEMYRPRAAERGIELDVEAQSSALLARADYSALQRVLDNLVGNALKFTPGGGSIRLRAHQETNAVSIIIEDTGPGISDNMLDHLFEPFVQSPDETDETVKGSGLGLAITRRLVTAMRGSIKLDESYEEGARFCIELPIPASARRRSTRPSTAEPSDTNAPKKAAAARDERGEEKPQNGRAARQPSENERIDDERFDETKAGEETSDDAPSGDTASKNGAAGASVKENSAEEPSS